LIPHTLKKTTLGIKSIGDKVNIEFDIVGKYISSLLPKK
jgi:riboflavin synthase